MLLSRATALRRPAAASAVAAARLPWAAQLPITAPAFAAASPCASSGVRCHCQVPCGIFDDGARVAALKEDAATIRKAMVQINELSAEPGPLALNQVRSAHSPSHAGRAAVTAAVTAARPLLRRRRGGS